MAIKKKLILTIWSTCIPLVILAAVYMQQLNATSENEKVKEFLHTMYTVTADESTELLANITSGSLTEEMTNRPLRKKYERLMTRSGFQEAIDSRAIWSHEITLAMENSVMTVESIHCAESEFSTPGKPAYQYTAHVKVQALDSQGTVTFQPEGTLYLEKSLTGWKIGRLLVDETSSVDYQIQAKR